MFEIHSPIGAGGMGEVYRARDTKLNREVALKILPDVVAADPDRVARFQREAQLLASLNHPNIGAIYGFEDTTAVRALVLELVAGPTLADRIANGPLSLSDALPIAEQIAAALEAAHDKGVVHRDLKPANIKLTGDGSVKVLDFGLAKLLAADSVNASGERNRGLSMSPTLSVHATYAGVILGTAAYMSPEQARGRQVDKRTDIWAFGCVVFEMIAGARPFDGDDVAEMIGAVIHKEPAWDRLPAATPAAVRIALQRCLQKDPKQRIRDIGDARLAMSGAFESPRVEAPPIIMQAARRFSFLLVSAVAAAVVATAAAITLLLRSPGPSAQPVRFSIVTRQPHQFNVQGFFRNIAISDDGGLIAYVGGSDAQLMLRSRDQLDAVPLTGIVGAGFPFFSPDGRWIGFFTGGSAQLKKVAVTGGSAVTLCSYQGTPRGAVWGRDGTIVFATNDSASGLMTVAAAGGEPKVLTTPEGARGEHYHWYPSLLPDGKRVLFTLTGGVGAAGIEAAQIAVFDPGTRQTKIILRGGSDAQYVDTGHIVYAFAGTLRAVRFDPARLEVLGDPVPVVEHAMTMQTGAADFRVSPNGTLVYVPAGVVGVARTLVWRARDGRKESIAAPPRAYAIARLSPDETQVAVDVRDQQNDIWIWDFRRQTLLPLTFDPSADDNPVWTPDGRRIAFASARAGQLNIFWQAADGTGTAERLTTSANIQAPSSFTPDGKGLLFQEVRAKTGADLLLLHLDRARQIEPIIESEFTDVGGEISPDGRWLAYYSNEGNAPAVWVRPFPNANGGRWLVSSGGGTRPTWSKDGRELFYLSVPRLDVAGGSMMAVPVQTSPSFSAGSPTKLFDGPVYALNAARTFDVSRDGKRFLIIEDALSGADSSAPPALTVVLNWTEELKARLPPAK